MTYLLQFCGLSDPLELFYLEQCNSEPGNGPAFAGFRPFQLDDLLGWGQRIGQQRHWDLEAIYRAVIEAWMERADLIRQWQLRLREEPADRLLVAGLGTTHDWERRCETLLRA
ncbi:MAG: hypothetical protein ACKO3F_14165 [Cyanobium sp.]|jgi:hypothetical protein